jgi:phage terminase small subunit
MALTAKQEAFAQAIASGKTQADAYRHAFDAGNMKTETIHKRASELMANGDVKGRVVELKGALETKSLWTREMSVLALADIAQGLDARANEKVAAIKELNAMHGFNEPTKVQVAGEIVTRVILADMDDGDSDN